MASPRPSAADGGQPEWADWVFLPENVKWRRSTCKEIGTKLLREVLQGPSCDNMFTDDHNRQRGGALFRDRTQRPATMAFLAMVTSGCDLQVLVSTIWRKDKRLLVPNSECPICLEDIDPSELHGVHTCGFCNESFHAKCIKGWKKKSKACPCCKQDFKNRTN